MTDSNLLKAHQQLHKLIESQNNQEKILPQVISLLEPYRVNQAALDYLVKSPNDSGYNALSLAIYANQEKLFCYLGTQVRETIGFALLELAIKENCLPIIDHIKTLKPDLLEKKNPIGNNVLHIASVSEVTSPTLIHLLKTLGNKTVKILSRAVNRDGNIPAIVCLQSDKKEKTRFLIRKAEDLLYTDVKDRLILHEILKTSHGGLIDKIFKKLTQPQLISFYQRNADKRAEFKKYLEQFGEEWDLTEFTTKDNKTLSQIREELLDTNLVTRITESEKGKNLAVEPTVATTKRTPQKITLIFDASTSLTPYQDFWLSDAPQAASYGIYRALCDELCDQAVIMHPDSLSLSSLFQGSNTDALKIISDFIQDNLVAAKDGQKKLVKPLVLMLNTGSVKVASENQTQAIGGIHWLSCVILPQSYVYKDQRLTHRKARVYFIDPLEETAIPLSFQNLLTQGYEFMIDTEQGNISQAVPALFEPEAVEFIALSTGQQTNDKDCGYWCIYNAIKTIENGSAAYLEQPNPKPYELRQLYLGACEDYPIATPANDGTPAEVVFTQQAFRAAMNRCLIESLAGIQSFTEIVAQLEEPQTDPVNIATQAIILAVIETQQANPIAAIYHYQQLLRLEKNGQLRIDTLIKATLLLWLGIQQNLAQDYTAAVESLGQASLLNPQEGLNYFHLAMAYVWQHCYNDAIVEFSNYIDYLENSTSHPNLQKLAEVYTYRALSHIQLNQKEEAIIDLFKAIELCPKYEAAYFHRGVLFSEVEPESAVADFSKALSINSTNKSYYLQRGDAYVKQEKYKEATEDYLKIAPTDPEYAQAQKKLQTIAEQLPQSLSSPNKRSRSPSALTEQPTAKQACIRLGEVHSTLFKPTKQVSTKNLREETSDTDASSDLNNNNFYRPC